MKHLITKIFILILLISLINACKTTEESVGLNLPNPQMLDSIIDSYVDEGLFPFVFARVEDENGKTIYDHGKVNKKLLPNFELDKDSWIRIWSMSKIVTISIAMDLIEEGFLALDDPVVKFIPEFENLKVAVDANGKALAEIPWGPEREKACPFSLVKNDSVMTVLHLLNHQAGFYYATSGFNCLYDAVAEQNLPNAKNTDEFLKRLAVLPLVQHSGSTDFYGTNTTVLGMVAERASGKSLKELIEQRITKPYNIEGLQYGLPVDAALTPTFSGKDTVLRKAQNGELDIFGPDVPDYRLDHPLYLGGEGMVATADGYADFLRILLKHGQMNGHRFLEEKTVKEIYAPHTQLDNPYGYNGYNLWVTSDSMRINGQGDAGLWTGGGYESTHFWVDPKRKFVGVIMSQMSFAQPAGNSRDNAFRGALYQQIFDLEKQNQ